MTQDQLDAYQLLIILGGDLGPIVDGWTSSTDQMITKAVLQDGVSYLGICAGAFVAGAPQINLTGLPPVSSWNSFDFYSAYNSGTNVAMVEISLPTTLQFGSPMDTFWYDGPQLQGFGSVIANYPDGTPAVAEEAVPNNGFILLSGVHAEASVSWLHAYGLTVTGNAIQTNFAFVASLNQCRPDENPAASFWRR